MRLNRQRQLWIDIEGTTSKNYIGRVAKIRMQEKRKPGRPRMRWQDAIKEDIQWWGLENRVK